jgi:hypothetical protein
MQGKKKKKKKDGKKKLMGQRENFEELEMQQHTMTKSYNAEGGISTNAQNQRNVQNRVYLDNRSQSRVDYGFGLDQDNEQSIEDAHVNTSLLKAKQMSEMGRSQ